MGGVLLRRAEGGGISLRFWLVRHLRDGGVGVDHIFRTGLVPPHRRRFFVVLEVGKTNLSGSESLGLTAVLVV